jgi:hypothetical protein
MNDISSKIRKVGVWVWNQKEKMFLAALLLVLCFRAWVVLFNPPDVSAIGASPTPAPPAAAKPPAGKPGAVPAKLTADNVPDPPARPVQERPEDFRPLVRQNPFTIYGVMMGGTKSQGSDEETIDVTLNSIVKWGDGTYRAELTTKVSGKSKRYKEGEVFENYKLMTIDPKNKSVTIYSSAHDKTFELKLPQT